MIYGNSNKYNQPTFLSGTPITTITQDDIRTILQGAAMMLKVDATVAPEEKSLLKKLLDMSGMDSSVIKKTPNLDKDELFALSQRLSSPVARKAFLLAVATMALADSKLTENEVALLEELTQHLNVGRVKMHDLTYQNCESMVLKLLSQYKGKTAAGKTKQSNEQLSDFDMI